MTGEGSKYLIFSLQGRLYAFDLAHVAEVEEVPEVMWPIPSAPTCYPGAINFHGTIVAVMDLAVFLGIADRNTPQKMITLNGSIAALAFLVEQVIRIVPSDDVSLAAAPGDEFAAATLHLPNGEATLLDARLIVDKAHRTING